MASNFTSRTHLSRPSAASGDVLVYQDIELNLDDRLRTQLGRQQARLDQARQQLPRRARLFLDALPALLHYNPLGISGVEQSQPHGIREFELDQRSRNACRQLGVSLPGLPIETKHQLFALFLMGSTGSIGHTKGSDIDLWVCAPANFHITLRQKLDALERYAMTLGVTLQAFPVDPAHFRKQKASPVLLDEFYRSACWLAGAFPLWWLVPSEVSQEEYQNVAHQLQVNGHLQNNTWIDFGPIQNFATSTLLSAGIRILQNAPDDPYKALLKLALIQTYAEGATALANQELSQDVDPYLQLAQHLHNHFANTRQESYLQRAWLIKTSRGSANLNSTTSIQAQIPAWQVGAAELETLRWPQKWSVGELIAEHNRLTNALLDCLEHIWLHCQTHDQHLTGRWWQAQNKILDIKIPDANKHQASVAISADQQSFLVTDGDERLARHTSLWQSIDFLVAYGFGVGVLEPTSRQDPTIRRLFQLPSNTLWIINSEPGASEDEFHISDQDDPLSFGQPRRSMIKSSIWRGERTESFFHEHLAMAIQHNLGEAQIAVAGTNRRHAIERRIISLLATARAHLKTENDVFLYALGRDIAGVKMIGPEQMEPIYIQEPADWSDDLATACITFDPNSQPTSQVERLIATFTKADHGSS